MDRLRECDDFILSLQLGFRGMCPLLQYSNEVIDAGQAWVVYMSILLLIRAILTYNTLMYPCTSTFSRFTLNVDPCPSLHAKLVVVDLGHSLQCFPFCHFIANSTSIALEQGTKTRLYFSRLRVAMVIYDGAD